MSNKPEILVAMDKAEAKIALGAVHKLIREHKWDRMSDDDWQNLLDVVSLGEKLRNYVEYGEVTA